MAVLALPGPNPSPTTHRWASLVLVGRGRKGRAVCCWVGLLCCVWARCAAWGCAPQGAVLGSVLSNEGFKSGGVDVIVTKTGKRALQARHLLVCLLVVNFFMLQAVLVPKIDRSPGGRRISGVSPGLCPSYRQEHRSSRVSIRVGINKQTMGMCLLGTGSCWSFLTQN